MPVATSGDQRPRVGHASIIPSRRQFAPCEPSGWFYSDGKLDEATLFPTVLDVTGRPPRTFAQWTRANAARFHER